MSLTWTILRKPWGRKFAHFLRRHQWFFPVLSFMAGVASFLLVDRGEALAIVIALTVLAGWLVVTAEPLIAALVKQRTGRELSPALVRFGAQAAHQEAFFFVLPFFFFSTVWGSGQLVFMVLLALVALISVLDPIYFDKLGRHRGWFLGFHAFAIFVTALTVLPIIFKLTTAQSYLFATLSIGLAWAPGLDALFKNHPRRSFLSAVLLAALMGGAWLARPWVPPATLRVTEAVISHTLDVEQRTPGLAVRGLSATDLGRGLYAYTAIRAPRGLDEAVFHVWKRNGHEVDRIELQVHGERQAGYRTWSHKLKFGDAVAGRWQVDLETAGGQRLGVLKFTVN